MSKCYWILISPNLCSISGIPCVMDDSSSSKGGQVQYIVSNSNIKFIEHYGRRPPGCGGCNVNVCKYSPYM